jgi:hypothetical protein
MTMNALKFAGMGCLIVLALIGAFFVFFWVSCLLNPPSFH